MRLIPILVSLAFLLLVSCKKEKEEEVPQPKAERPSLPLTNVAGTKATLQATYFSTLQDSGALGIITHFAGYGKALLHNLSDNQIATIRVKAELVPLFYKGNHFSNNPGSSQGIDFGSEIIWEIDGTGNVPDFTKVLQDAVPEIGDINVGDSINRSEDLALIIDQSHPLTNMRGSIDSVNYQLIGPKSSLRINTLWGDTVRLNPTQLQQLGKGQMYIQAEAYRQQMESFSGYTVAFVNKGVLLREVWLY